MRSGGNADQRRLVGQVQTLSRLRIPMPSLENNHLEVVFLTILAFMILILCCVPLFVMVDGLERLAMWLSGNTTVAIVYFIIVALVMIVVDILSEEKNLRKIFYIIDDTISILIGSAGIPIFVKLYTIPTILNAPGYGFGMAIDFIICVVSIIFEYGIYLFLFLFVGTFKYGRLLLRPLLSIGIAYIMYLMTSL